MGSAFVVTVLCFIALIAAYYAYGRYLATHVFRLNPERATPAHALEDGVDYVPTRVPVLFGHHFASIAGLGPILGPAVAVIWGWVPAVLWVVCGSILIGAVHDLGALTVSLRYQGRSIGDVCREIIGKRARLLFLLIIFFLMSLAMGSFVNAISSLFVQFNPDAIIPSFGLMLVAVGVGVAVYRLRLPLGLVTVCGLVLFAGLIFWGARQPVPAYWWFLSHETQEALTAGRDAQTGPSFATPYGSNDAKRYLAAVDNTAASQEIYAQDAETQQETGAEIQAKRMLIFVLLGYAFLASVLPVWLLLQPRDYINSFQLYFALIVLVLGLMLAAYRGDSAAAIHAPAVHSAVPLSASAAGSTITIFPLLFVTIACGAVSGFHSLVSSGTTVRQLNKETDALPIGFGAMLVEGALAVLVIMCCVAGLGAAAWGSNGPYSYWQTAGGLATPLNAVVTGGANFLAHVGIPTHYGTAILAVTIVAFALTTLDSATRLLRFNVEEIFRSVGLHALANRYVGSMCAVAGIAAFGLLPAGKILWVMFGTTNQLLAGLTLLTVSLFLYKLNRPIVYTVIPMVFMLTMTLWAMFANLADVWRVVQVAWVESADVWLVFRRLAEYWQDPRRSWLLDATTVVVLVMTLWLILEAMLSFAKGRGGSELDEIPSGSGAQAQTAPARATQLG